jgi:cytidylate kinase
MNKNNHIIIAIDGPAASGKGTVARNLAAALGFTHLDTGKIYRAVGKKLAELMPGFENIPLNSKEFQEFAKIAYSIARGITIDDTKRTDLETEVVGRYASVVSAIPEVRKALLDFQRNFAKKGANTVGGTVLDGRDIGTVIVPNANFKFYITASPDVRANRRFLQLQKAGKPVTEEAVLQDILERDKRDSERKTAPLKPAADAKVIDTTNLSVDEVFETCLKLVKSSQSA